jgi:hypothetical protein
MATGGFIASFVNSISTSRPGFPRAHLDIMPGGSLGKEFTAHEFGGASIATFRGLA